MVIGWLGIASDATYTSVDACANAMSPEEFIQQRLALITKLMHEQGLVGNPRRHIVLHKRDSIIDWSGEYRLKTSLPSPLLGASVWVVDGPDVDVLVKATVLEERNSTLLGAAWWCSRTVDGHEVQLLADAIYALPMPRSPKVIKRIELDKYIGKKAARELAAIRLTKLNGRDI